MVSFTQRNASGDVLVEENYLFRSCRLFNPLYTGFHCYMLDESILFFHFWGLFCRFDSIIDGKSVSKRY